MAEQETRDTFLLRDADGALFFPPKSLSLSGGDTFWTWVADSDTPPFLLFQRFASEVSAVKPDLLEEFVRERSYFAAPDALLLRLRANASVESWLETPVCVNLGLTVDSGFDYTLNATYPAYGGRIYDGENKGLFDRSSIMWLTRRQGYRQAELREALFQIKENKDAIESPYLRSAAMEIWHELSDLNQLCFFISIPLRELLLMMSMQRWGNKHKKWPGYVLVGTETVCGFLDRFQGSCSLLGIRLEKPVKLPLDVLEIEPDGSYGYGIYEIRGYEPNHIPEVWKPGCVRYYGLPRGFRRDAASMGIRRLPAAEKNRQ